MKLGKKIKYKGKDYVLKAEINTGAEIIYVIGKEDWILEKCIEVKREDFE